MRLTVCYRKGQDLILGNKSSRAALFKRAYAPPGFSEGGIITRIINEGAERLGFDDERQLDIPVKRWI